MTIYLIDYENVREGGFAGLTDIHDDYVVHLFYSDNANRISLDALRGLRAGFGVHKVNTGKQSLDKQLVSYLGYVIAKYPRDTKFVIVSRDNGFLNTAAFWRDELGITVKTAPDLTGKGERTEKSQPAAAPAAAEAQPAAPAKQENRNQNRSGQTRNNNRSNRGRQQPRSTEGVTTVREWPAPAPAAEEQPAPVPEAEEQPAPVEPETVPAPEETPAEAPAQEAAAETASAEEAPAGQETAEAAAPEETAEEPADEAEAAAEQPAQPKRSRSRGRRGGRRNRKPAAAAAENTAPAEETSAGQETAAADTPEKPAEKPAAEPAEAAPAEETPAAAPAPETPAEQPAEPAQEPSPAEDPEREQRIAAKKKQLEIRLAEILVEKQFEKDPGMKIINSVMGHCTDKNMRQLVYLDMIKGFGQKRGLEYYAMLKPLLRQIT